MPGVVRSFFHSSTFGEALSPWPITAPYVIPGICSSGDHPYHLWLQDFGTITETVPVSSVTRTPGGADVEPTEVELVGMELADVELPDFKLGGVEL